MIESLHNHTTTSDGVLSYKELLSLAEQLGVGVVAFTDHDALPQKDALDFLMSVKDGRTKWIIGIEMTAAIPLEFVSYKTTIHVVGLFVDPTNFELLLHCSKIKEARITRMQYIVERLHELGFILTEEDCMRESCGESVGRPHIVAALLKYPENDVIIERLRFEMEEAARTDSRLADKYEEMIQRGKLRYPYELFLSEDAFRPAYIDMEYSPDIDEVVKLIRHAGGMAFIAHYSYEREKLNMDAMRTLLRDNRVDGVEVIYGGGVRGTKRESVFEEDKVALRTLAAMYGRQISGGADAHYPEDLQKYAADKEVVSESKGLAQKIIDSGFVEVKNSNFMQ